MLCRFYLQIINQLQIRNAPVDARRCNTPIQIEIDMKCTNNSIDPPSFVWNMSLGIHDSGRNAMMLEREIPAGGAGGKRSDIYGVLMLAVCVRPPPPQNKMLICHFQPFRFCRCQKKRAGCQLYRFQIQLMWLTGWWLTNGGEITAWIWCTYIYAKS